MWLEDTWTTGITTARGALTLSRLKDGRREHTTLPPRGAKGVTGPSLILSQPWEGLAEPRNPPGLSLGALLGAGSLLLWLGHGNGVTHKGEQQRAGMIPMAGWKMWHFYQPFLQDGTWLTKCDPGWHLWAWPSLFPSQGLVGLKHQFSGTWIPSYKSRLWSCNLVSISGCFWLIYICWGTETEEILHLNLRITRWFRLKRSWSSFDSKHPAMNRTPSTRPNCSN